MFDERKRFPTDNSDVSLLDPENDAAERASFLFLLSSIRCIVGPTFTKCRAIQYLALWVLICVGDEELFFACSFTKAVWDGAPPKIVLFRMDSGAGIYIYILKYLLPIWIVICLDLKVLNSSIFVPNTVQTSDILIRLQCFTIIDVKVAYEEIVVLHPSNPLPSPFNCQTAVRDKACCRTT